MLHTRFDVNYALKILTAYTTQVNRDGHLQELKTLQAIAKEVEEQNESPFVPELVDHFETTGPHGDHSCFVLQLRSTDVTSFRRSAPSGRLLLHDVKMVVLHALYALKIIHNLGLIHTGISQYRASYRIISKFDCLDVKPSDMLLVPGVEDDVPSIIEGEIEIQGTTYPIMKAQPLQHTFQWDDKYLEAEMHLFCLNDVGSGERESLLNNRVGHCQADCQPCSYSC